MHILFVDNKYVWQKTRDLVYFRRIIIKINDICTFILVIFKPTNKISQFYDIYVDFEKSSNEIQLTIMVYLS